MRTLEGILTEHPFFSGWEPRYLQVAVGCASNVRFNAGEFVFQEGEEADIFYLIREGRVALEVVFPGRGPVVIDARAVTMTRAIALDGKCLRGKCEEDHELGYELVKQVASSLGQRLDATRLRLLDIYGVA
jgi:hypothetical protein